ncbi:glycosyltransferase family 61 protein [Ovoidimarina sediminis]|uniref:hypothetical protein n=1 Tax=Ovoidimarina sediminis TaxID=3079856 RepID=UPI0029070973|nr:hypothetical protein [Rhodophyticola sp. MJ-SS7]MDU8945525.1 hypothetical protein [Rhodophyticola sp. MJ-SS7]
MLKRKSVLGAHQALYEEGMKITTRSSWSVVQFSKKTMIRILRRLGFLDDSSITRERKSKYCAYFWGDQPASSIQDIILDSDPDEYLAGARCMRSYVVVNDFVVPPKNLKIANVTYTSNGFAWIGKKLDSNASVTKLTTRSVLRFFKEIPLRTPSRITQGTIVQAHTPYTYGDWVAEHRNSIISAKEFPRPLVLPAWIGTRPYVQKELSDLGIEYKVIEDNTLIEEAYVLSIKHLGNILLEEEVQFYREAFKVPNVIPKQGKIIYLSRVSFRRTVETPGRSYPSEIIGQIIRDIGGRVIDVDGKDRDYYRKFADEADIVIADHGGAMFNILEWRPRVVIEIVEDGWWIPCFVFLSAACGVNYHGIVRSSHRSESDLRDQITMHIENGVSKKDRLTIHEFCGESRV